MEQLRQGVKRFQRYVYPHRRALFAKLAKGQTPQALFITCADSRVVPALITSTDPGELFVDRNAGNFIPPFHGENASEAAGIQYALEVLQIPNIIICGHTDCGAMKAVWHPEKAEDLSCVKKWLVNGKEARKRALAKKLPEEKQLQELIERNVVVQLEHLRTYPAVASKLKAGKLQIAGWVYDIEHGKVLEYDAATDQFAVMRG
jgi:carbonic anhydrase